MVFEAEQDGIECPGCGAWFTAGSPGDGLLGHRCSGKDTRDDAVAATIGRLLREARRVPTVDDHDAA
jgi:hypothetical protein